MSRVPKDETSLVFPRDGQKITVNGTNLVALEAPRSGCVGCVADDLTKGDFSLCDKIHDHVDMCETFIWVVEIDYLKRKMRDD